MTEASARPRPFGYLQGRTNRITYLFAVVIIAVLYGLLLALLKDPPKVSEVVIVIVAVPRIHDLGRSGWWLLVPFGVEVAALVVAIAARLPEQEVYVLFGAVAALILVVIVSLGLIPGQTNANRFGEAPPPGLQFKRRRAA